MRLCVIIIIEQSIQAIQRTGIDYQEINRKKKYKEELKKLEALGSLDNTFLIIDEAHNFFNSITNGSKNATALYQLIMQAENLKLLFLTGSPIVNHPFEIAVCFNMLAGPLKRRQTLFGEDYYNFSKYFIKGYENTLLGIRNDQQPIIKNKNKFANRIVGLVSYYDPGAIDNGLFPKKLKVIVENIPMSLEQFGAYIIARDKELKETQKKSFSHKKQVLRKPEGLSSSYRVRSRQISNFLYPSYASRTYKDNRGYTRYEKFIEKLTKETLSLPELEKYSTKMVKLVSNIKSHLIPKYGELLTNFKSEKKNIGTGIVYSQFIDSGIGLLAKILDSHGFSHYNNEKGPHYAIISGEVDVIVRNNLIKEFNNKRNINGEYIALLLITSTGAEGISTKNVRHIHVIEPYWYWSRIDQVFARAIRMGSHMDLPLQDRNVQPYIYLSNYPKSIQEKKKKRKKGEILTIDQYESTTDITLYMKSIENQIMINSFLQTIQLTSVDCLLFNKNKNKCRLCSPTNETLFLDDLNDDLESPNTCKPIKEKKIEVNTIIVKNDDGKDLEFAYSKGHIFEFDSKLNAYVEIFEDHPLYFKILKKIKKK